VVTLMKVMVIFTIMMMVMMIAYGDDDDDNDDHAYFYRQRYFSIRNVDPIQVPLNIINIIYKW